VVLWNTRYDAALAQVRASGTVAVRATSVNGRRARAVSLLRRPVGLEAKIWIFGSLLAGSAGVLFATLVLPISVAPPAVADVPWWVVAAGFVGFEITWRKDVFGGAPQAGSAANYGTLGINFRARKASR
jgi:uncharacterized membrane protein YdcZ (DUF606 family)